MKKIDMHFNMKICILLLFIITVGLLGLMQHEKPISNSLYHKLKSTLHKQEKIIDHVEADELAYALINQEGFSEYGDLLAIYKQEEAENWNRIYETDFADLKPWKLEIADIDGDGEKEILTAVYKTTHFDENQKNRLFIFNFSDGKLYKKWTGSQIAGVWKNFYARDFLSIPGSELIFIEQMEDHSERISVYYWFDFGFVLLAESNGYDDIQDLSIAGKNSISITYKEKQQRKTITLMVDNGKLIKTTSEP